MNASSAEIARIDRFETMLMTASGGMRNTPLIRAVAHVQLEQQSRDQHLSNKEECGS
jgi:hypothetical protein